MADTSNFPIPPANFLFLVESLLMQAQMQLGLFKMGETDDEESGTQSSLARHSIDLLTVLQEKTRGNLTAEEQRLLENGITELRFRFVQISEELQKSGAPPVDTAPAANDDSPRIITSDGGKGIKSN